MVTASIGTFLIKVEKRKEEQRNRGNSGIDNPIFGVASSI